MKEVPSAGPGALPYKAAREKRVWTIKPVVLRNVNHRLAERISRRATGYRLKGGGYKRLKNVKLKMSAWSHIGCNAY